MKTIRILGTRGIPAAHGGFETFAENLSRYLVKKGWQITVYCQEEGNGQRTESDWFGIRRVHIPVRQQGALGTIIFDWKSTIHAVRESGLVLTLGYNTAVFGFLFRTKGINNIINMDGIEWKRAKWSKPVKIWFWLNEYLGGWFGNHLIADNPGIVHHLVRHIPHDKISMIPYGADSILQGDKKWLELHGLESDQFVTLIARPVPENSVLEIVRAFSKKPRKIKLVVLGEYSMSESYHRAVKENASTDVRFLGGIYEKPAIQALRYHSALYLHGHTVGGTNPSLVEAMAAGNPILAHDNQFNQWVSGPNARYFHDEESFAIELDKILENSELRESMAKSSRLRHREKFTWGQVLHEYEQLLTNWQTETASSQGSYIQN